MAESAWKGVREYGEDVENMDMPDAQSLGEMAIGTGLAAYGVRRVMRGRRPSTNKFLTEPAIVLGGAMNAHGFGRAVDASSQKRKTRARK